MRRPVELAVKSRQTVAGENSPLSASLIGRSGSSTFRLSTTAVSMSLTGSRFSSDSAPKPFHHGIRGRGGTICYAAVHDHGQPARQRHDRLLHPAAPGDLHRPCPLSAKSRSASQIRAMPKRPSELTSSIVPRGTSFQPRPVLRSDAMVHEEESARATNHLNNK